MKSRSSIFALLCASVPIATAVPPRPRGEAATRPFPITGFATQGYPPALEDGKHVSFTEFNITRSTGEPSILCWAWAIADDLSIGDVPKTNCQSDPTVMWSLIRTPDEGFNFTVSWQYTGHGLLLGSGMIPSSEMTWLLDDTNTPFEAYVGPSSFSVDTVDVTTAS